MALDVRAIVHNPLAIGVIVVGGLGGMFLASRLQSRRASSDSSATDQQPIIYSQAPVTSMADEEDLEDIRKQLADLKYRDSKGVPQQPAPPQVPPVQLPQPIPPSQLPNPRKLPPVQPCPKGYHWVPLAGKCMPDTPVTPKPQQPPTAPPKQPPTAPKLPPAPPVPGDVPTTCQGVGKLASENPGYYDPNTIERWTNDYIKSGHSDHIAWQRSLNMAIGGTTGKANLRSLRNDYLGTRAKQATYNGLRRAHGLKALTNAQYDQLLADLDAEIKAHGSRDAFSKQFVYTMFAKWHAPFVCKG